MKYTFRFIQTHPKCPSVVGWYWFINTPEMLEELFRITSPHIGGATSRVAERFAKRPELRGHYIDPVAGILDITMRFKYEDKKFNIFDIAREASDMHAKPKSECFIKYGAIYVGPNLFGFTPFSNQLVLKEEIKDEFIFPVEEEVITIGRWPGGTHYYLRSNTHRPLEDTKYESYSEAKDKAMEFVRDKSKIKRVDKFMYIHQGD